jgi:hypothetical protein
MFCSSCHSFDCNCGVSPLKTVIRQVQAIFEQIKKVLIFRPNCKKTFRASVPLIRAVCAPRQWVNRVLSLAVPGSFLTAQHEPGDQEVLT